MISKINIIKAVRNTYFCTLLTAKRLTECRGRKVFEDPVLNSDMGCDLLYAVINLYDDPSIHDVVNRQMRDLKATVNAEMHWDACCPSCDCEVDDYPWLY